jgi:hypothetical protein
MAQQQIAAVAWLNEADYPAHLALDPQLQPAWQVWLDNARKGVAKAEREGFQVIKVVVDPKDLSDWCAAQGRKVDASARAAFAVHHMRRGMS